MAADLNEHLDTLSQVLWRCVVLGIALLFLWVAGFLFARHLIYRQGAWFGLTPHECDVIHYGGMGLVKSFVLVFFLLPHFAVRMVLRKRRRSSPGLLK